MDRLGRRMAVHDHLVERPLVFEEALTNPEQVRPRLRVQRLARARAGVGEEIVADHGALRRRLKQLEMGGGRCGGERFGGCGPRLDIPPARRLNAVRDQRLASAEVGPDGAGGRIVEKFEQHLVMIAEQEPRLDPALRPQIHQALQDSIRVGTTVDIIPEEHHRSVRGGGARLGQDGVQQRAQEIVAAVDVSDGVDDLAWRDTCADGPGHSLRRRIEAATAFEQPSEHDHTSPGPSARPPVHGSLCGPVAQTYKPLVTPTDSRCLAAAGYK